MRSTENIGPVGRQGGLSAEGSRCRGRARPEAAGGVAEGDVGWGGRFLFFCYLNTLNVSQKVIRIHMCVSMC